MSSTFSSTALLLGAKAQKAIDVVLDTPSRMSIASFRHDLLDEDEGFEGVRPET